MSDIVYSLAHWDDEKRKWIPYRICDTSLEDIAEALRIIEEAYPEREVKIVQYTESEFQIVRQFGKEG